MPEITVPKGYEKLAEDIIRKWASSNKRKKTAFGQRPCRGCSHLAKDGNCKLVSIHCINSLNRPYWLDIDEVQNAIRAGTLRI